MTDPSAANAPHIGFIGAGQMGEPMVERLLGAGFAVTVHARRPERRTELAALGADVVAQPAAAARAADVLICCTFSDAQLVTALVDDGALAATRPGTIVVDHVTGSPRTVDALASGAPDGVEVLDAPISGSADQIRRGELTVLLGGPADAVARVGAVLGAYASTILPCGHRGDAMKVKLINNLLFSANVCMAGEVHRLARDLGLDPGAVARAIGHCSGATNALALLGGTDLAAFDRNIRPFLEKDVAVVEQVAAELGVDLGELRRVAAPYSLTSD